MSSFGRRSPERLEKEKRKRTLPQFLEEEGPHRHSSGLVNGKVSG